jgi:hypothetical protein
MPSSHPTSVRKANPYCAKLIESYCVACGLLIAASSRPQVLTVMEKLHSCPVYFHYPQPISQRPAEPASSPEAAKHTK